MDLPTYADVVSAAPIVHRHMRPTPLYEWPALSRLLGCRYYLKHENHTPTTAFKVRGGIPLGRGSGIGGAAGVPAERRLSGRISGVQWEGAPAVTLSWREGRPIETDTPKTFAEGMATRVPARLTLEIMRRLVHDMVLVSDVELEETIRLLLRVTHNLAEGAGAASTAAAWKLRSQLAGKTGGGGPSRRNPEPA